jgi:integrase
MKGCRPLTEAEVRVVLQSFGGQYALRDKALFLLGVKSGFRITELLSLRVGDVLRHGQLVDRVTVARRHMKQRREGRSVVLHPEAKAALAAWLDACARPGPLAPATYVFRSRKGGNRPVGRRQALRILHEAYATNGLTGKVATHSMRKTFANHVYRHLSRRRAAGEALDPFRLTSKALGHRNLNSTDAYLSFLEADIEEAILAG